MNKTISLFISILLFFQISMANAWDRVGHQIIAAIALDQLSQVEKQYFNNLLQQFPDGKSDDLISVASWADDLRNDGVNVFNQWHYINIPFRAEKVKVRLPSVPNSNIVTAISDGQQVLINKNTKPWEKSFFLRFLVHLVGDIHQPLHCVTRISKYRLAGDRGGTDYYVQFPWDDQRQAQPLHALWDKEIGLYPDLEKNFDPEQIKKVARALEREYPKESFQKELAKTDFYQWAGESFYFAKKFVYQTKEGKVPTNGYLEKARLIVKKRLVLAGYRLGGLLDQIYRSLQNPS